MLRSPAERAAAHYNFQIVKMGKRLTFEQWIAEPRYRNRQTQYLVGSENADDAIELLRNEFLFVGLTHRLDETLVLLRRAIGEPSMRLEYPRYENTRFGWIQRLLLADRMYKAAPNSDLARQILSDPRLRSLAEEANQADQRLFDFVDRELFPNQIIAYGPDFGRHVAALRDHNHPPLVSAGWLANRIKRNIIYKPALAIYRLAHR
jgi:hypothetical protein